MSQPVEQTVNETVNDESVVEFVPLLNFEDDYEILNQYPFTIRKKSNHRVLRESLSAGYVQIALNRRPFKKHRLIGLQFLDNPDPINFDVIDHKNHNRADNHLSNLRWSSSSSKGVQYEYVDDIPDNAIVIDFYEMKNGERREFEANKYYYYFDESNNKDVFYGRITDDLYKVLHINSNKSGNEYVSLKDVDDKSVKVYINRFKYQHDLL